jgi:hypothetical protein
MVLMPAAINHADLVTDMCYYCYDRQVLTIGATNLAQELDQALLRPGRFEVRRSFRPPPLTGCWWGGSRGCKQTAQNCKFLGIKPFEKSSSCVVLQPVSRAMTSCTTQQLSGAHFPLLLVTSPAGLAAAWQQSYWLVLLAACLVHLNGRGVYFNA